MVNTSIHINSSRFPLQKIYNHFQFVLSEYYCDTFIDSVFPVKIINNFTSIPSGAISVAVKELNEGQFLNTVLTGILIM